MSLRLPDVLRHHHSKTMLYLQVKAVTFEKITKVDGLTDSLNREGRFSLTHSAGCGVHIPMRFSPTLPRNLLRGLSLFHSIRLNVSSREVIW